MNHRHPSPDALRSILADLLVFRDHDRRYLLAKKNERVSYFEGDQEIVTGWREIPPGLAMALDAARMKLRASLTEHAAAACSGWTEELRENLQNLCVFIERASHPSLIDEKSRADHVYRSGGCPADCQSAIEAVLERLRRIERVQNRLKQRQDAIQPGPEPQEEKPAKDPIVIDMAKVSATHLPDYQCAYEIWQKAPSPDTALETYHLEATKPGRAWRKFENCDGNPCKKVMQVAVKRYAERMKLPLRSFKKPGRNGDNPLATA